MTARPVPGGQGRSGPVRFPFGRIATYTLVVAMLAVPPLADSFAEPGQKVDPVVLSVLGGGKAPLVSPKARVNVLLFFRSGQDRSIDALRQLAGCERELAPKGIRFVGVISGSASPAEVKAALAAAGATFAVLVDEGDKVYNAFQVRMLPVAGITDGAGVLQAMEPYRQVDFGDVVRARIRFQLGEIDKAALEAAVNPAAAPLPGGDPVKKARRDVKMARKLLELGQLEAAVKQAQRALEQAPVPEAFPVLGLAYARLGRCGEARRMLDQAQAALPASPELPEARALCAGK